MISSPLMPEMAAELVVDVPVSVPVIVGLEIEPVIPEIDPPFNEICPEIPLISVPWIASDPFSPVSVVGSILTSEVKVPVTIS